MDRNQKLKNYHARKVRERQQQQQQKENVVENTTATATTTTTTTGRPPSPISMTAMSNLFTSTTTTTTFSAAAAAAPKASYCEMTSPSSFSSLGNGDNNVALLSLDVTQPISDGTNNNTTKKYNTSNDGRQLPSSSLQYVNDTTTTTTTKIRASSRSSRSLFANTNDNISSFENTTNTNDDDNFTMKEEHTSNNNNIIMVDNRIALLKNKAGGGRGGGVGGGEKKEEEKGPFSSSSLSAGMIRKYAEKDSVPTTTITTATTTTTTTTTTTLGGRKVSTIPIPTSTLPKSNEQGSSSSGSGGGRINNNNDTTTTHTTTTNNNNNTTNNAAAAARMFAARRRKAQLEMMSMGGNTTTNDDLIIATAANVGAGGGNGGGVASAGSGSGGVAGGDSKSSSTVGISSTTSSSGSSSSSSSSIGGGGTTKALSLFARGGGGGNSSSSDNHHHNNTDKNEIDWMTSQGRESVDSTTINSSSSSSSSGRSSSRTSTRGGIGGGGGTLASSSLSSRKDGLKSSSLLLLNTTVREEGSSSSFSSMATIKVSNRQKKKMVQSSNDDDNADDGDDCKSAGAAPTPILRQPHHYHYETKNLAIKEEEEGHSKSVRFHLSPLEREKKAEKKKKKTKEVVANKKAVGRATAAAEAHQKVVSSNVTVLESTSPHGDICDDDDGVQASLPKSSSTSLIESDDDPTVNSTPRIMNEASHNINLAAGGDEEEEHDEEFAMFLNGLRREVSGDHTMLWSEFQSIMGRAPKEHVALYQFNDSESDEDKDDPKKKKKKKKIRMDPQTTKTLNAIYKQFHDQDQRTKSSSRRFMTNKSQLTNDKDIAKQQREEKRAGRDEVTRTEEHSRDRIVGDKSPVRRRSPQEEARVKSMSKSTHQSSQNNNTSFGVDNESAAVKLRPTPTRSSTKTEPGNSSTSTPKNELFSVKLRPTPTKTPPPTNAAIESFTTPTPQKSFTIGIGSSGNKIPRLLQRSSSKSSSGRSISSGDEKEKKRHNWMDSLKKKQKSHKSKQMADSNISVEVEAGDILDRNGVASHRKKLRITPPSSPEENEGQVPPWAKVHLRTTQRREELLSDTPTGSVGGSTPKSFTPSETFVPADSLPPLCCVGDTIDLDSLPKRLFPEEAATVFPLRNKDANDESEQFVIVGSIAIVTASSSAGNNGRKVNITWWCHRSAIRTLTLNVEATGATIAHANGRMPLVFESSDIGLNFAQAFYRGPSKQVSQAPSPPQPHHAPKKDPKESAKKELFDSTKEDSRSRIGSGDVRAGLTEAEVSLLDEYRHFDETEKPKLRLVSLSPKGEDVIEVTLSARNLANNAATDELDASKQKEGSEPSLTNEEANSVSKYKKMLAVGLPPDAVRNKMTLEGASANVVAAVLGTDKPALPKLKPSKMGEEEEKLVSKYKKMLMVGIPTDAVRHKMVTEGVPVNVVAAVLGPDENESKKSAEKETKVDGEVTDPRQALLAAIKKKGDHNDSSTPTDPKQALFDAIKDKGAEPPKTKLSDEEDRIASKFRRMLKMGIPLEAVQHGMKKEGVNPKIAAAVAEEAPPQVTVSEPMTPAKPKSGSAAGPALSEEEEKIAAKYRKMLKLCIPKDAVRHDMKKEGVSDKIVEAIFGKEDTSKTDNMETPARGKNTKTIGFHWKTANLPPELFEQTIFARSATKKRKRGVINPEEDDIKKLEEIFQKKDNANIGKVKSGQSNSGNGMAKLLDITRANNIAIQLKAFNDFTLRALAETIDDLDPDSKIVGERVEFMSQLLPTPKELQEIKAYKGGSDRLNTAELFFQQLLPVKRFENKVEVMKTMCTFNEHAEEARVAFKTLEEVCGQITTSSKLEQIVSFVLDTGNLMNEGSLDGGVEAFKFESLTKLSQTKSADGKTTVLDYIVETFIEKGERQTLFLNSDFPYIQESCRLSINDLCGDVNTLRQNYQLCKTELSNMKRDQAPKPAKSIANKTNEVESADPRKALFAAIQKRGANVDNNLSKPPVDPRQALFAAIKNKGADNSNNTSVATPYVKYSRGVKKLESFIWKAEATLSLTEREQGAAIRACKGLAVLCGEEGGERSASSLLQVLSTFASSLVAAVEKYDMRAGASRRHMVQIKSAQQKNEKENQVNDLPKKEPLLKASSLQPHVRVTDKIKRVHEDSNTSSSVRVKSGLSPKTRNTLAPSNDDDARSAMFAAIKSRNEKPVGVTNTVRTINTNVQRRESRVLMVNKMLKEAPANVREDFLRGVTYRETSDPLLQKIYEKEGVEGNTPDDLKPVDPRQELFAVIKSRRQG